MLRVNRSYYLSDINIMQLIMIAGFISDIRRFKDLLLYYSGIIYF